MNKHTATRLLLQQLLVVLNHDAPLFGLKAQLIPEVRVGNGDQLAGPLAQALAPQVGNAILGDNIVHIVLAGGADGAGGEDGLDLADGAPLAVEVKAMKLLPPLLWQAPRT